MSKFIPASLLSHYLEQCTTVAYGLLVEREDAQIFGFTSDNRDVEIDGVNFEANQGLLVTAIEIASNSAVGNLELTTLNDGTHTAADILGGVWRNAAFTLLRYNYEDPLIETPGLTLSDVEILLAGNVGETVLRDNLVVAEMRDLRQYWQQPIGSQSQKNCRYRLGDAKCRKVISAPPFTVTGTVTTVDSKQTFRDSGRTEIDDYFGIGKLIWNTGNNANQAKQIKTFTQAGGIFTFSLPMLSTIQVGDTYTAIAGCRWRLEEDCRIKFDNVLNYGGEPHRRLTNNVIKPPPQAVG